MKIKKNAFSTLVLELFSPSTANCRKLKIQKNPKIDFPYWLYYEDKETDKGRGILYTVV
jgi:hypothetical protein